MSEEATSRALDRDVFLLIVMVAIAGGLFLLTRNMAAREHQMEVRTAAIWYARGERQLGSGEIEKAIDSLRKAVANDRENRKYAFALADALGAGDHDQEAAQTILRLRELDPENAEINLVLGRLASKRGDISAAVHYYENAIYGLWTGSQVDERRRQVRIELIRFLLAHQRRDRALSELLTLNGDLTKTAASHDQTGELFLQAGDAPHALKNFSEASKLSPHDPSALTGAGEASFELSDYLKARRYLEAALLQDPESKHAQHLLSLVQTVLSGDPLAPHISLKERQHRLFAGYQQAFRRLQNCLAQPSMKREKSNLKDLATEATTMKSKLQLQDIRRDPELVRSGLDLVYRMETSANAACGEAGEQDEALLLIASKHDGKQ